MYVNRPPLVVRMIGSPGTSSSMWRNGRSWLTRWPPTTTLPNCPGMAVPGQWPGPRFNVESVIPSHIEWSNWIFGMAIVPICTAGSIAFGFGGACGCGSVAAVVVGRVAGTVVAAVVGATVVVGIVVGAAVTVT